MSHNVVIVKAGSDKEVGNATDAKASLKDGYERDFCARNAGSKAITY
jgi:hypothetical protein